MSSARDRAAPLSAVPAQSSNPASLLAGLRVAGVALQPALKWVIRELAGQIAEVLDERSRPPAPKYVDRATIAQVLGLCTATIANLEKQGLPHVRFGDSVRYSIDAVEEWAVKRSRGDGA